MSAMCVFFFFTTTGRRTLIETGEVEFMALFLPQIIFGAWAILSVYYDLVSSDRQHNVLDCILCSGVSKTLIFSSKIITLAVISLILSLAYLLPVTAVILSISENFEQIPELLRYVLPLWGYIMVYAALGTAISVTARSTKSALIVSLAAGLVLMPRLFLLIVEGLGGLFGWTQSVKDAVSMAAPGVMMEALAHNTGTAGYYKMEAVFAASIAMLVTLALLVFNKQDERSYGE
jgi:ABC-type transport system involved in multi-copper enzyme maturation permease subunit